MKKPKIKPRLMWAVVRNDTGEMIDLFWNRESASAWASRGGHTQRVQRVLVTAPPKARKK